ncbi:MAG TPA: dephospho-CoA kinase [Gaiellaceae bacterium]
MTRLRPTKHLLPRTKHPPPRTRHLLPSSPFPTSTNAKRPLAVAITGGIGAGKSAALAAFARHGAATRSSDEIVHRLLRSDPEVRRELVERFGPDVIGSDGADRAVVASIVFNDPEQLDWLEELLHPRVVQDHSAWRRQLAEGPDPPAVTVTEVPLLYETGGDKRFDIVVVITAPPDVRAERRPIADERERRLLPDDEKVRLADYAYVNDGTLADLDAFVAGVMADLGT